MKKVLLLIISMVIWLTFNLLSLAYLPAIVVLLLLTLSIVIEIGIIELILNPRQFKKREIKMKNKENLIFNK